MNRYAVSAFFALAFVAVASAMPASAQATRTWVSGLGDDANPCSRTAPCKTFPGAYSRTAVGGEIDVIDPGGFGTISIGHAITIDGGGGVMASILASNTNAVNINAGASDVVTLRHLTLTGILGYITPGFEGVKYNSGLMVILDHDVIENFSQHCVSMTTAATAYLSIMDSEIQYCSSGGVNVTTTSGTAVAGISNTGVIISGYGVSTGPNANVSVTHLFAEGNGDAVVAQGPNANVGVNASLLMQNTSGIHSKSGSHIWYADSMITDNATGILTDAGGTTTSWLNNRVFNNAIENLPTNTLVQN